MVGFTNKFNICRLIVLFIIFTTLQLLLFSTTTYAETKDNISWTNTEPTVFSATITPFLGQGVCQGYYQNMDLAGENDPKRTCMFNGNNISFGIYYFGNSMNYSSSIGFPFDSRMYKLNNVCYNYDDCLYLPDEDTLVTKKYFSNTPVRTLVVYKNFKSRLKKTFNLSSASVEYNFDINNPDLIFRDATSYAWQIGSFGASKNGKWLAIEFKSRGIYVLNIETLQMRRILVTDNYYDQGMDPAFEFAVSNDGEHLAAMGRNAGLSIYDIPQTCGDIVTDKNIVNMGPFAVSCKRASINLSGYITSFRDAYRPYFSDDGGELSFSVTSNNWETKQVSLRAGGYVSKMIDYLALGDSYSSGEGETDDKYYLPGTNDEYEKCHISSRSYPFVVASLQKIDPLRVKSVACSGATTEDVIGDNPKYFGQGNRLGEGSLDLNPTDKLSSQIESIQLFIPGRIQQSKFVEEYSPKVITIGIGGNDAGLMGKLRLCIGPGTCDVASTNIGKEQAAAEIKNLYGTLVKTYQELHMASPNSKIYAIGYPKIINISTECGLINGFLLDKTERQFMNEGIIYLNQVIKAAATTVGIGYIETQESFSDHVLCGLSQPIAMNAIRLGDDGPIVDIFSQIKVIGNESFHPNSIGHSYIAATIDKSVKSLLNDNYCPNNAVICPAETLAPEPSIYWIPGIKHNYQTQKATNFVFDRENTINSLQKEIIIQDYLLSPNSNVSVKITSEPKLLGDYQTTKNGSLDIDLNLPEDTEEGYHTIHLYGTSFSGEPIELYQIIQYQKPVIVTENENINTTKQINTKEEATQSAASLTAQIDDNLNTPSENIITPVNNNSGEVMGYSTTNNSQVITSDQEDEQANEPEQISPIQSNSPWKTITVLVSAITITALLICLIRKIIRTIA